MKYLSAQHDIMKVIRGAYSAANATPPLSFRLPESHEVKEPFARIDVVDARQLNALHSMHTVNVTVWCGGNNARARSTRAALDVYGFLMDLPTHDGVPVVKAEPVYGVVTTIDPQLNIPISKFSIALTSTNERRAT